MHSTESADRRLQEIPWHAIPLGEALARVGAKEGGLTGREASRRLERDGPNVLGKEERASRWRTLVRQFLHPLIVLLVLAGAVTLALRQWLDGAVIFIVVFLNTAVGFFQERKAEKALDSLHKEEREFAWVRRDGRWRRVRAEDIVAGDRILLRSGDRIPADGRLARAVRLRVSEAVLTGEAEPVQKTAEVLPEETELPERANMVWRGTAVVDGKGEAVVTATGPHTEFGRIGELTGRVRETRTPFERRVARLGRFLGGATVLVVLVLFGLGVASGRGVVEMFTLSVAVTVSAIPEGLPIALTAILAIGMLRILKRGGLVKTLAAAQALGSTSVIITDKTGTLTEGRMRVAGVLMAHKKGGMLHLTESESDRRHLRALQIGALTADVFIENPQDLAKEWRVRGSPTDRAIVRALFDAGTRLDALEELFEPAGDIPFSAERRYGASIRSLKGSRTLFVTGAPETLLRSVKKAEFSEGTVPLGRDDLSELRAQVGQLANRGLRVLLTAYRALDPDEDAERAAGLGESDGGLKNLTFVALVTLSDPVRDEVPETVKETRRAGVRTVIATGDHALTAVAIGKEIGMLPPPRTLLNVMEGGEVRALSDEELSKRVRSVDVFARVTPEQKLRITRAWQEHGEVVATFGDGVNDAPSLKHADVGVAVSSGTDLAKEAADIVLLKNSFSTIVSAVREGRVIIDNLKKVVTYMLSDSFTEVVLLSVAILAGLPLPVLPAQILWAKVVADVGPSIALAFEPAEKDVMSFPPLSQASSLVDREMWFLIVVVGVLTDVILVGLFLFFLGQELAIEKVRTIIFAALAVETLLYAFSMRSLRRPLWRIPLFANRYLIGAVGAGVVLTLLAVYVPPFSTLTRAVPITGVEWIIIAGFGILNVTAIEVGKWLYWRRKS